VSPVDTGRLAGSVKWAVVPFAPRPPFRLYAGERHPPIVVPHPETIIAGARRSGGEAELTYLVSGKARPVLILSEPPTLHDREVTALRLLRLSKLTSDEQARVRRQEDELLFHLTPNRFDLPEENAVLVGALVRVHIDAIDSGPPLGMLDDAEMRVLGERIIHHYRFDTRLLIERRLRELIASRQAPQ